MRALARLFACASWVLMFACTTQDSVSLRGRVNFAPPPVAEPEPLLKDHVAIAKALKQGGYIIYFRHGRTRYDQLELERDNRRAGKLDLNNCETQRQLSDVGRSELQLAGQQFRQAAIALDQGFSSLYCRAKESALFFVDSATPTESLSGEGEVGLNPANKPRTIAFFSQIPAPGKNHFMMAHGGIFWEATGFVIQEAHAVVMNPRNLKSLVARIAPDEWGDIARAMTRP